MPGVGTLNIAGINVMDHVLAAGVGLVDDAVIEADAKAGRMGSFKAWTDWFRVGGLAIALGGQAMMPRQAALFSTASIALTPLAVKSLRAALASRTAPASAASEARRFVARTGLRDWAPGSGGAAPGGYRPL